jgi:hypothetical protein
MPGVVAHAAGLMFLLVLAALPRGAVAQGMPPNILLGKWCSEAANYVFTNQKLSVYRPDGQFLREIAISRFESGQDWITVFWNAPPVDGTPSNTLFNNFTPNREAMEQAQQVSGNKGPRRIFRRC